MSKTQAVPGSLTEANGKDEWYSEEETARRRDEVVRQMANTPPQHRVSPKRSDRGKAAATDAGRKPRKSPSIPNAG